MKTMIRNTLFVVSLMSATGALAVEMPGDASKLGCTGCHSIDKALMGPAWKEVAKKYAGDKEAESKLILKVSKGGSGNWGDSAMPPMDPYGSKQAAIKSLVNFILGLK